MNGLAVTWDYTLDGHTFANALSIMDSIGTGTFQFTTTAVALGCNLTINANDTGSGNVGFASIGGHNLTLAAAFSGPLTLDNGTVNTSGSGTTIISGALTLNGGTLNNNGPVLTGGVTFSGTNATLNNASTISTTAVTMSGTGDVLNNTGTVSSGITVAAGEALVNSGTISGTITFSGGLIVSSVNIASAELSATLPEGATLLITGGTWTTAFANAGTVLDAVLGGSGATVASGNPIIDLPPSSEVQAGKTYGVPSFGPDGKAGLLTGTRSGNMFIQS
jgi:hypothetical protein